MAEWTVNVAELARVWKIRVRRCAEVNYRIEGSGRAQALPFCGNVRNSLVRLRLCNRDSRMACLHKQLADGRVLRRNRIDTHRLPEPDVAVNGLGKNREGAVYAH